MGASPGQRTHGRTQSDAVSPELTRPAWWTTGAAGHIGLDPEEGNSMAAVTTPVPSLIYLDEQGRARIQGTRFKVIQIARDTREGLTVEVLQEAYSHLSLAQIHAALS